MKAHSKTYFENENMFLEKWKVINPFLQARMKLPKKRRRVVAVEQPRRNARRMGQSGSTAGGNQRGNGGGGDGAGLHRRMNAIKSGGGHSISHSHTNNSIPNTQGGTYRLPNAPHDKMGKSPWSTYLPINHTFPLKFIYSEKATIFCEVSTVDSSYIVTVNFVKFCSLLRIYEVYGLQGICSDMRFCWMFESRLFLNWVHRLSCWGLVLFRYFGGFCCIGRILHLPSFKKCWYICLNDGQFQIHFCLLKIGVSRLANKHLNFTFVLQQHNINYELPIQTPVPSLFDSWSLTAGYPDPHFTGYWSFSFKKSSSRPASGRRA